MFEGYIAGKFANHFFEKDIFNTIKTHALVAALVMSIPDFGLGTIFFVIILWHMYSSICSKVGISFSEHFWKLVGLGFIVNIIIAFFLDFIFTFLFFLEGFLVYFQFYLSGKLFVESLKNSDIKVDQQDRNINSLPASLGNLTVTLNNFGFATFACENALDLTEIKDLKAWQVIGISEGTIKCKLITSPVSAGTGILLTGVPGTRYSLFPTASGVNISGTNLLKGITIDTRFEGNEYYGLRDNAFVPLDAGTIPAGKAVLPAKSVNCEVKSYSIFFDTSYNIISDRKDDMLLLEVLRQNGILSEMENDRQKRRSLLQKDKQPLENESENQFEILRNLKSLLDACILSKEEYNTLKEEVLVSTSLPIWRADKSMADTLKELKSMTDEGVLSLEEFTRYKTNILNAN